MLSFVPRRPGLRLRTWMGRSLARRLGRNAFRPDLSHDVARVQIDKSVERLAFARGVSVTRSELAGLSALSFKPEGTTRGDLLYLHGGGYVIGSAKSHGPFVSQLVASWRLTAVSPNYRLAPEHPCPAAIEDALAAFRALRQDRRGPLLLAGDSAGGGLALATVIALRDCGETLPDAIILFSPWTDLSLSGASVRERAEIEPMLTPEGLANAARMYRGALPADDPRASPLFAELRGLPPVFIQAGEDEILLDDTLRLHARLEAAGVEATAEVWRGVWHDFQMFQPIVPEASAAIKTSAKWLEAQLEAMNASRS